jgi:hypothetical protein
MALCVLKAAASSRSEQLLSPAVVKHLCMVHTFDHIDCMRNKAAAIVDEGCTGVEGFST